MILIDANIPMYVVGADHPHKADAQRMLERAAINRDRLVTDADVFQEILHRYTAINRRDAIQPAFDLLNEVVDEIFVIDGPVVERAKSLILGYQQLSARDAIHASTMHAHGVITIMSFDAGFDVIPGLTRLSN